MLQGLLILQRPDLLLHVQVGLSQEAGRAAGRVVDRLADARVDHLDHEADDRARGVELAGDAVLRAHADQQVLVEAGDGEEVLLPLELDLVDDLDHLLEVVVRGADRQVAHHRLVAHAFVGEQPGDGAPQRRSAQAGQAGQ